MGPATNIPSEIIPVGHRVVLMAAWAYGTVRGTRPVCDGGLFYIVELEQPSAYHFDGLGNVLADPATLLDCGPAATARCAFSSGGYA